MINNSLIKSEITFNHQENLDDSQYFHVAYGVDEKFTYGVGTSIASIIENNQDTLFHFHIFIDNLTVRQLFEALTKNSKNLISIYLIDNEKFKSLPLPSQAWSHAIYFRLLIISSLSSKIDELLYLDADIICKGNLSELKKLKFDDDVYLYAVTDKYCREKKNLPIEMNNYFNSGFLYLSTQKFISNDIPNRVIELVSNNNFSHPDQDALNILLHDKLINISENYNYMFSLDNYITSRSKIDKIPEDVIFIHYVGLTKPFHEWATFYEEYKYFANARNVSPWKNIPLLKARDYKHLSRKKSHLRKNKKHVAFIITSLQYLYKKIVA